MRTKLSEFDEEMRLAVSEFWDREPSTRDAVMVCWTEDDDLLHGGFCEPADALECIADVCKLNESGAALVRDVLKKPTYLNTRSVRVLFLHDDAGGLHWYVCEEAVVGVGAA